MSNSSIQNSKTSWYTYAVCLKISRQDKKKKSFVSWAWYYSPVIPAFGQLWKKDDLNLEFCANLSNGVRFASKSKQNSPSLVWTGPDGAAL